jgi:uncharacterized protein (DUF1778 family)
MTKYKLLRIRITAEQYDLVCSKAGFYGFKNISDFIRHITLKEIAYMRMIKEIHEKVCK